MTATFQFDPITADIKVVWEGIKANPTLEILQGLNKRPSDTPQEQERISRLIGNLAMEGDLDYEVALEILRGRPDDKATYEISVIGKFKAASKALEILKDRPGEAVSQHIVEIGLKGDEYYGSEKRDGGFFYPAFEILVEREDYRDAARLLHQMPRISGVEVALVSEAFAHAANATNAELLQKEGVALLKSTFATPSALVSIIELGEGDSKLSGILKRACAREIKWGPLPFTVAEMQKRLDAACTYVAYFAPPEKGPT